MSMVRSSPSCVGACCSCCLTDAKAIILEVIAPPSSPVISLIWTRVVSSCFALVLKWYNRAGGLKASSLYIACRALNVMTTSAESGPGMPLSH